MRHPKAYGTAAHTGAFSDSKGIAVVIYENGKKNDNERQQRPNRAAENRPAL